MNTKALSFLRLTGLTLSGILIAIPTYAELVMTGVSSETQFTYAADVSNSDLLDGLTPVTTGWNEGNDASPLELTDGIHGVGFDVVFDDKVQGAWTTVGATAEYHLGAGTNGLGFDLTSIVSIADWVNVGFGNQVWTIEVRPVGGSYSTLATIDNQELINGIGTTKVTLTDDSGILATGVEFIRVTAESQSGHQSGAFVWRELDVFGTPTGSASSLSLKIGQTNGSLNFEWDSLEGKQYDLVSSTDLSAPVNTWAVYDEDGPDEIEPYENIVGTGSTISLTGIAKIGDVRFFALIEK